MSDPYEREEFWAVMREHEEAVADWEHDFRVGRASELSDDPALAWPQQNEPEDRAA